MGLENLRTRFFGNKNESHVDDSAPRLHHSKKNYLGSESAYSFNYYSHVIDKGSSSEVWDTMLDQLDTKGRKRIVGVLKRDNKLCWSNDTKTHFMLISSALTQQEQETDSVGAFLSILGYGDSVSISVFSYEPDPDAVKKLADYLDRNIIKNRENTDILVDVVGLDPIFQGKIDDYSKVREMNKPSQ